jgi:hypothetical protein
MMAGSHSAVLSIFFWQRFHPSTPVGTLLFSFLVDFYTSLGFLLDNPVGALANPDAISGSLTPTIIEAKKDKLFLAIPQATIAVASYCKQHKYVHCS